jgi:hypothetical protein
MNWTTVADLRQQTQKWWDKGTILEALVSEEALFPKRLILKGPSSADMLANFDKVRLWSQSLVAMPHIKLEMREVNHRQLGFNQLPAEAWLENSAAAIALLGKQKQVRQFTELLALTLERQPLLRVWLAKRPLRALELSGVWSHLLDVVSWMCAHPRPLIYLRQIDIPGVHSKFVETHRTVLAELFDICLPAEYIDTSALGLAQFSLRYGFLDKPQRIRLRVLDLACSPLLGITTPDLTLDADSLSGLGNLATQIFITENEINFLAFPAQKNSVVVFGSGYGFDALSRAKWLQDCQIYYWGDIDTHGFAILNELRAHFPHVQSFLMDRDTLHAFSSLWGNEETPVLRDLTRLTLEEQALYDDLRDNRIQTNLRLEQERIGFGWVLEKLATLAK